MIERNKTKQSGFSLIELLIVIGIIGILAAISVPVFGIAREKVFLVRAKWEFRSIETALEMYKDDHDGDYPADVGRQIPPGLEEYLSSGDWSGAAWPGSVYDWDSYMNHGDRVYQISIRFCPAGGELDECKFPSTSWAEGFDTRSAVYYCLQGTCKSHPGVADNHPGYCVNCGG